MTQQGVEAAGENQTGSLHRDSDRFTILRAELHDEDFAQFFGQSVDMLCIAGLEDGHFKRVNPAWTTSLGWHEVDLLGKPFIDFVHADDREQTLGEVASLRSGEVTISFENRYRSVNGSYRWLQWNARPHPSRHRIYAVARDITRRKQHEREIVQIVDRERQRLGREMHDGLCQTLTGIAALSATLSKTLEATCGTDLSRRADEISTLLRDAIGDARDMAHGLEALGCDRTGLNGALETLAVNVQHMFPVSCRAGGCLKTLNLDKHTELHLFRIAQEAVNNSIVHGRAGRILISLHDENGQGILRVQDNGVGIPENEPYRKGMGLHTMAYRARLINANLNVQRHEAGGTVVTCTFPLAS